MAGMLSTLDEAIHVVVTPSQASYFAGEPFTVTITITNTRSPETAVSRSASQSANSLHKRGAHSISSVPLSRPPTSPGIRTALPTLRPKETPGNVNIPTRKGLIGKGGKAALNGRLLENGHGEDVMARRQNVSKSLSVTVVSSQELEPELKEDVKGKSPLRKLQSSSVYPSPTSPRISSPLKRSASLPTNHPHARKQSVFEGQLQLQELRPSSSMSPFMPTSTPTTSTFSLSLDTISETSPHASPMPFTPVLPSPTPERPPANIRAPIPSIPLANKNGIPSSYSYPPGAPTASSSQTPRRPPQLGLGHGPPPTPPQSRATRSVFGTPSSELILYLYAQFTGSVAITLPAESTATLEQTRTLNTIRSSLLKGKAIGGGSLDIASMSGQSPSYSPLSPSRRNSHTRSTSLSSSIFSLLSPTTPAPTPSSASWTPSHKVRSPSMFSGFLSSPSPSFNVTTATSTTPNMTGLGLGLSNEDDPWMDPNQPLPTLEVQPSMIAVDLSLGPGESRSYTYTVDLPENLPPTFRGRSLRFSYQFHLGICRATSDGGRYGVTGSNSSSRVMKVPIRIYNHVNVGRRPSPYDLLWPVSIRKWKNVQLTGKVVESPAAGKKPSLPVAPIPGDLDKLARVGTYEDLQAYVHSLLASIPPQPFSAENVASTSAHLRNKGFLPYPMSPPLTTAVGPAGLGVDEEEFPSSLGCREAVEILTRNPKKLSYDVNKDGVKVAVLTFTKTAYRLGETVLGVVELNERESRARVLKLSALLEAHETLPGGIASPTNTRHMRRVHAEQHSSFMMSTLRTTFALDIPPDGSPAFQVDVIGDGASTLSPRLPNGSSSPFTPGGLEWKVRLCLLVAVASETSSTNTVGVRMKSMVRDGPRGDWGVSWKAARTIAPSERIDPNATAKQLQQPVQSPTSAISWVSYFASALMGSTEYGYHDGDEDIENDSLPDEDEQNMWGRSEEEWKAVKVEMVECEVPIKVWPGNTAFKATEVVFDV